MVVSVPRRQQGFILAAVLWVLAVMFIAVGIFHAYVERKAAVGLLAKERIQDELDVLSTEQTLLYSLGTSRMTLAGLSFSRVTQEQQNNEQFSAISAVGDELWMDGTVYAGLGNAEFALQDNAGLIAINALDQSVLRAFLGNYEESESTRSRLLGSLHDYIDVDDALSLGGAEQQDYLLQKLPAPPNDYLRAVPELWQVMGWREWLGEHPQIDPQRWFCLGRFSVLNPNTMPKSLLMSYLHLDKSLVDKLIQMRRTDPFRSAEDFILRTNLLMHLDDERLRFLPGNDLRMTIWNKRGGQARLISLQLTPNGLMGPWLVDYEHSVQTLDNDNEALAIRQSTLFDHPMDTGQ